MARVYNEKTKVWEYIPLSEVKIGDLFFLYDDRGHTIVNENGYALFVAQSDAYFEDNEWVVDVKTRFE